VRSLALDMLGVDRWSFTNLAGVPTATMAVLELMLARQAVDTLPPVGGEGHRLVEREAHRLRRRGLVALRQCCSAG
jgi:hypothetical protein